MILSFFHHTTSYRLTHDQWTYLFCTKAIQSIELGTSGFFAYNLQQVLVGLSL